MRGETVGFFYHKANKEAFTVICFVVKHLGSGSAIKKSTTCFPLDFFRALPLPACFTTKQSTDEASF